LIFTKRKIIFSILYFCLLLVLIEIISRTEWSFRKEVPFLSTNVNFYYPELNKIEGVEINKKDDSFDVLLLGGSVFHENWGNISRLLLEKMTYEKKQAVRIHNMASPGHTSLDSYYKYRHLADKKFDLILIYHAINDLRLNNCPSSMYKADYSHYSWYKVVNLFERHRNLPDIATLFSFYYRITRLIEKCGYPPRYIPKKQPTEEWTRHGNKIKSAESFRINLEKILRLAEKKKERVILMTFCFYVSEKYSLEKFKKKQLDYSLHDSAIEIWGIPDNIINGIKIHNNVIRDIAGRSDFVMFIDQNSIFPKTGKYFNDICHFTQKGCELFVDNIMDKICTPIKRRAQAFNAQYFKNPYYECRK